MRKILSWRKTNQQENSPVLDDNEVKVRRYKSDLDYPDDTYVVSEATYANKTSV